MTVARAIASILLTTVPRPRFLRGRGVFPGWTRSYRGDQDSLPRSRRSSMGPDPHDRVAEML